MRLKNSPPNKNRNAGTRAFFADVKRWIEEKKAIERGHFVLASGFHSEFYFQAQKLFQHPEIASRIGGAMADLWKRRKIDKVVSLAIGGIVLGQEVARHLGVCHIFLERKNGELLLRRSFEIGKGERILLVEDVITTGGSLKEAIKIIKRKKAKIIGIAAFVSRRKTQFAYPLKILLDLKLPVYRPAVCPLCRRRVKLSVPGTKASK
ncbi:MAG: orotate phosphoribosyltransferase [Elusimicrobia bacterium]|nr:orotate phosphoribosyltransferase [Elusimicrobiota bacterium]